MTDNDEGDDIDNPPTVRPPEEFQISSVERLNYERKVAAAKAAAPSPEVKRAREQAQTLKDVLITIAPEYQAWTTRRLKEIFAADNAAAAAAASQAGGVH